MTRARTRWLFVVVLTTAFMALAAPAQAHMLKKPKPATKTKLHHYNVRSYRHAKQALRWIQRHPQLTTRSSDMRDRRISRASIRGHLWLARASKRKINAYRERQAARRLNTAPPHVNLWLCIHRGEGSWRDPNAPYYGGMQMDSAFMRAHAPAWLRRRGTADFWTPNQQMWVAEIAVFRHGASITGSWPNTAPPCL